MKIMSLSVKLIIFNIIKINLMSLRIRKIKKMIQLLKKLIN